VKKFAQTTSGSKKDINYATSYLHIEIELIVLLIHADRHETFVEVSCKLIILLANQITYYCTYLVKKER